jgi:hypothetical protein
MQSVKKYVKNKKSKFSLFYLYLDVLSFVSVILVYNYFYLINKQMSEEGKILEIISKTKVISEVRRPFGRRITR